MSPATVVADQQSAKIFPTAFGWRVTTDAKFLLLSKFDFDPGPAAPARLIDCLLAIEPSSWNCHATWSSSSLSELYPSDWDKR